MSRYGEIFQNILNESMLLNEKRIELQNERPVTKDEIIRFLDNSDRIQWRGKYDSKTQRIYINSTDQGGQERYDLLAEVEITSIGYILRGRDGFCYQGESYEDFKNDMIDAIRHFDSNVFDTLGGSGEDVLNKEFKEAAYNLGTLKLYCDTDIVSSRWDHDDNDLPYIVDSKNEPPLFTVKWVDTEEHPKSYAVSDGKTTDFFSDRESAYQKIKDIMRQSSSLEEAKNQLFDKILNEADHTYVAKVGDLYLQGNDLTSDPEEADVFESKTEPTQRINQMKKDGKIKKNKKISIIKESKEAAYALTKLKALLKFDTRWVYVGDEPCLVDDENPAPMYSVNWMGPDDKEHPNTYAVSVKDHIGDVWDWTVHYFSDERSTYEKIEDVMRQSSALLEGKGDFKKYALLGAAALGLGAVKVADVKDIKSKADELNIKIPAAEYVCSHRDAQLIRPIYKYKYDNKGPLNIESLCKWLERNTEFENIGYEEDGDNYIIKYRNVYYSYADDSSNPERRTTYGKIDLPKSYFDDWTYSLDESKKIALFDKLLKG